MILFHEKLNTRFKEYGFKFALDDQRPHKIAALLREKFGPSLFYSDVNKIRSLEQKDLLLAHLPTYVSGLFDGRKQKDLILKAMDAQDAFSEEGVVNNERYDEKLQKRSFNDLVKNVLAEAGGTYQAMQVALNEGFCYFLGGGMHHAMSFGGAGFCLINDIVIGIRKLQSTHKIKNVWVIDLDAHKGDGTAELTYADSSIATLSIHMSNSWPLDGEMYDWEGNLRPSFIASTIDIPIGAGLERQYLKKLEKGLEELQEKTWKKPDLVVVVDGVDVFEGDELESAKSMRLSKKQVLERSQMVFSFLHELGVPQAYVIGGGYGPNAYKLHADFLSWVYEDVFDVPTLESSSYEDEDEDEEDTEVDSSQDSESEQFADTHVEVVLDSERAPEKEEVTTRPETKVIVTKSGLTFTPPNKTNKPVQPQKNQRPPVKNNNSTNKVVREKVDRYKMPQNYNSVDYLPSWEESIAEFSYSDSFDPQGNFKGTEKKWLPKKNNNNKNNQKKRSGHGVDEGQPDYDYSSDRGQYIAQDMALEFNHYVLGEDHDFIRRGRDDINYNSENYLQKQKQRKERRIQARLNQNKPEE